MIQESLAVLQAGGPVATMLVILASILYATAILRAFTLRRGFRGDVGQLVQSLAAERLSEPDPRLGWDGGAVPHFIRLGLARLQHEAACVHDLDRWFGQASGRLAGHGATLRSLATVAPLLGLLGTVSGMVETFASLEQKGGVSLTHATEQTVAGGISVALITTQLGLIVGVPGLALVRILARRERKRLDELWRARSMLIEYLDQPPEAPR